MAKIESEKGWILGKYDSWDQDIIEMKLMSGDIVQIGAIQDTASVVVKAGMGATRVTVFPGIRPLEVETFGVVLSISALEPERSKVLEFELKGIDSFVQVIQGESVLRVRNERR